MATGKRYYWIKLKESFMTSDTIDYFMEQPDGANYVVLYQLLCLKTINTGGRLSRQIGEITIPYDAKIQRDCKWFSADTIRVALNLYLSVGLIYEDVDGTLVLTDHKNLVGSETDYAAQKKNQRKSPPQLPPLGVDIVHSDVHENVHTDIDIRDREKRLEKELEIDMKRRWTRSILQPKNKPRYGTNSRRNRNTPIGTPILGSSAARAERCVPLSECVSIITHSRKHRVQKRKNLRPSSISNWLAIKWGYIRTRDTSPLRRAGAGTVPCKPFKAQMARESGALSTGGVAPSPSRHRRAEGGEMRCNRRRRQKVL